MPDQILHCHPDKTLQKSKTRENSLSSHLRPQPTLLEDYLMTPTRKLSTSNLTEPHAEFLGLTHMSFHGVCLTLETT
jgi:hypothetical protein